MRCYRCDVWPCSCSQKIIQGNCLDVLRELPSESINCCVTSPPYWGLRDYGTDGQLGQESTPEEYVAGMVAVFREVRRVLRGDGTLWLNLGDSYFGSWGNYGGGSRGDGKQRPIKKGSSAQNPVWDGLEGYRPVASFKHDSLKAKDLVGIPWRVAFALQADGWYLRQDIIWSKPNPMPESVRDRCTKSHEYIFLLSKSKKYYYNSEAIKEPVTQSSLERLGQDVANQEGSGRVPGKTNGKMKAVKFGGTKAAGYGTRIHSGKEWNPGDTDGLTRNKRSVWTVTTKPFKGAHFATFPVDLIEPCVLAGCPAGGTVLDPFMGSGTTLAVAMDAGCEGIGIELNEEYIKLATKRLRQDVLNFE